MSIRVNSDTGEVSISDTCQADLNTLHIQLHIQVHKLT